VADAEKEIAVEKEVKLYKGGSRIKGYMNITSAGRGRTGGGLYTRRPAEAPGVER
jgi:hypothetical protein